MFLGIDPGYRKLGFALIDEKLNILDAGVITNFQKKNPYKKILEIKSELDKYSGLKAVGIEKYFVNKISVTNAEFFYASRGVIITMFMEKNVPVYEFSPTKIKKFVTGNGKASKKFVENMITRIFQIETQQKYSDFYDALAISYVTMKLISSGHL